ncbi:hypothetical protein [Fluviicola sp.]|uniref:hypothetical protein n=1 Tax=Fluviicola sp. TaxID=1917219 RepID=UPI0031DC6589
MRFLFPLLLLLLSVQTNPEGVLGSYELVLENHSKQLIDIRKVNSYEETEHRWRDGKWVLKCRYIGKWWVDGDTLFLKPIRVVWADKHVTECRDADDSKQPGCCFTTNYFYDDKSIWNFGPISKTKYLFDKVKTKEN